jgi:hypothetical protein
MAKAGSRRNVRTLGAGQGSLHSEMLQVGGVCDKSRAAGYAQCWRGLCQQGEYLLPQLF